MPSRFELWKYRAVLAALVGLVAQTILTHVEVDK